MNIRPKTLRRLILLFVAIALVIAAGAALYVHNAHARATRLAKSRAVGLAAFKSGEYEVALAALSAYPRQETSDTEVMFAYGKSRSRVELPNDKNVEEAIQEYKRLLAIDPNHLEAKHELLLLYKRWRYNAEGISLADEILAAHPNDTPALGAKQIALDRLHKLDGALALSMRINELDPQNLEQQLATFDLMRRLKRPAIEILNRAQQLQSAHEDNPRFELLLAIAYGYCGDDEQGKLWLRKAAARPAPDAAFVYNITRVFDTLKLFDESQTVLDRAVSQNPDPHIMRVLVQRLWQSGGADLAAKRLENLNPNDPRSDCDLLAFRALSLCQLDRTKEAAPPIQALSLRKNDPRALAWAGALTARFGETKLDPKAALERYTTAISRDPENAVIRFMVGEAYAQLGETELAIAAWKKAADLVPSWATPHVLIADAYASTSRLTDALEEAREAVQCSPTEVAPMATLVTVRYEMLKQHGSPAELTELLRQVEQVQKRSPGEPQTLPVYVSLLASTGKRAEALAAINTTISRERTYDESALIRLASASRANNLGMESSIFQAAAKDRPSPRVALAQAADMAQRGKPLDGLALLQHHLDAAAKNQQVAWKLALTEYREAIHDAAAAQDWIAAGDANPSDLAVQIAVLKNGASARADRDFISRTIDRLKNLTGPDAINWRLERARWLIGSQTKEKDSAEAINILTDIVRESPKLLEARLLLAAAKQQLANTAGATKDMQAAAELAPQSSTINIELAALLQQQAKFQESRAYLERAARSQDLAPQSRRRVAAMLAQQGDSARAAELLEAIPRTQLDDESLILLADIYRRLGRTSDAHGIFAQSMSRKILSADLIAAAAEFYAMQKRPDQAQAALARLPELQTQSGVRELILANFEERFGTKEAAVKNYVAATHAAPTNADTWRQLAAFYMRGGQYERAVEALDGGLKAIPNNAELKSLRSVAADFAVASFGAVDSRPLAEAVVANPALTPALEMLAAFKDAKASNLPPDRIASRLSGILDRFPRFTPAHIATIQVYVSQGKVAEAMAAAQRASECLPGDAEPARLAAEVGRMARQWERMAAAAQAWRDRSLDDPMPANLALAEAKLHLGDAKGAVAIVAPYAAPASADPDRNVAAIGTIARIFAAGGKDSDARKMLEPLLNKGKNWRILWLAVASENVPARDAATRWIEQAAPLVPADADDERFALASAWHEISMRFDDATAAQHAMEILKPLCDRPTASADAIALFANMSQNAGDFAAAEAAYRRALAMNPNLAGALNNLAYMLLSQGKSLPEARKLAEKAVALSPRQAAFHDTLARIAARTGDTQQALASFQTALSIEPDNLEALIGRASTLAGAGKKEEANKLLPQIDALIQSRPALSDALQRELELVRNSAKASIN